MILENFNINWEKLQFLKENICGPFQIFTFLQVLTTNANIFNLKEHMFLSSLVNKR